MVQKGTFQTPVPPPDRHNCVAVIPCRNEAAFIGNVVCGVRVYIDSVWVFDDGSSDNTRAIAAAAGARVTRLPPPEGKGRALIFAMQSTFQAGFEWMLCLDGDGQHAPEDIPRLFERSKTNQARLIIGDRMHQAASIPRVRRWTNQWMSRRISLLTGLDLPDSQCGFRLVHLPTLAGLRLQAERFEIESEMILQLALAGFPPAFAPIQVRYGAERSKIRPLTDAWRWFCWWSRARRLARTSSRQAEE